MEDTATAPTERSRVPGPGAPAGERRRARAWSKQPHHRRRRWLALALAAVLVVVAVVVGTGGGGARHVLGVGGAGGFFTRIQTLAGNGATSFAATETAAENAAINGTLAYTPYVRVAGGQHREVALTFDDGPGPYTPEILSILEQRDVPATFFEVGVVEHYFSASTSEIAARGYTIGDHTYSHAPMGALSPADQRAQLLGGASALRKYGAPFPRLFRPPYGSWNRATLKLLRKYRMLMVLWTVDTSDYRRPGVRSIVDAILSGARPGAIFLLHDAGGDRLQTVEALPQIISELRARGYRFVTVPKLLLDNPASADQQISTVIGAGG